MKNEKNKFIFCIAIFYMVFATVCLAIGLYHGCTNAGSGDEDSQRVERYEDGNRSAVETIGKLESGLSDVEEQMHGIGREIESGITDVGDLREVGDRIAGASSDIADSAGRIEKGIQRIEQILSEAEEKNNVLADGIGSPGNSGSD